jgi:homoserine dehydrogenase
MSQMKPINVGILGLGTVGGGVVQVLARNGGEIARRAGREIRVTHATASSSRMQTTSSRIRTSMSCAN